MIVNNDSTEHGSAHTTRHELHDGSQAIEQNETGHRVTYAPAASESIPSNGKIVHGPAGAAHRNVVNNVDASVEDMTRYKYERGLRGG